MGITGTIAAVGAASSVASLGMKAGSDAASGYAKKQELGVKAQNALLESEAKATNYELQAKSAATNYRLQGEASSTNYLYQGKQQEEQFDIAAGQDRMQASEHETAAQFGELQASMTDAGARRQLSQTLGNITTMRAAGGADFTSPTTAALMGDVTGVSNMNRSAAVASIKGQVGEEKAAAEYLRQASDFALAQGASASAMGRYNADTAKTFAGFNATTAEAYGKYNADTTRAYGRYNADAALGLGDTAVDLGYMNATTDILGGLGKMFSGMPGGSSSSVSGGSAAP